MKTKIFVLAAALIMTHSKANAGDIARAVVDPEGASAGSFLELGISAGVSRLPLVGFREPDGSFDTMSAVNDRVNDQFYDLSVGLQGRYQYKRFFVEAIADSFSDITLGVNLKSSETNSLDLVATRMFGDVSIDEYAGYENISKRKGDISLGFRNSFYRDDSIVQYEVFADANGARGGIVAALQYGRQFQVRNWNFHSLTGIRYFSDKVMDHYFGVSEQESSANISAYNAKSGFMPTILLGATVPINEKWVFKAQGEYSLFPETVRDSPLAQGDGLHVLQVGFYRVLYSG